jgi:hypothetical protein
MISPVPNRVLSGNIDEISRPTVYLFCNRSLAAAGFLRGKAARLFYGTSFYPQDGGF